VSIRIHQVLPVSFCNSVVEDPLERQVVLRPPPVEVNGEKEYQVSGVEDSRMYRTQLQYSIWLTRYDSLTCQPAKFLGRLQAVEEFHKQYPQKPEPLKNAVGGPRAYGGDTVVVLRNMKIPGNNDRYAERVWKELCYGLMETW
jgi:predicted GH43/DUF377 family glycosyl hydrolase